MAAAGIRVGVGGWTYAPWRDNFFPKGLAHSGELAYSSRRLTTIEINGTYYRTQSPASFAKWRDETPEDFVFTVKASRYATGHRVLAEAGESIDRFVNSGLAELGPKLGPLIWQFAPTKKFDANDFEAFLKMLPAQVGGCSLRHAMDVRHASFMVPEFLALARRYRVATVFADSDDYPSFSNLTTDFVYARLMRCEAGTPTGYPSDSLDRWGKIATEWNAGNDPADLPHVIEDASSVPAANEREVYVFFISGAKERAPAAAMTLLKRLHLTPNEA